MQQPRNLTIAVLSLGVLLHASVQVLRGGMLGELTGAQASTRPQLFLIDIGDEQRAGVEKLVATGAPRYTSPSPSTR